MAVPQFSAKWMIHLLMIGTAVCFGGNAIAQSAPAPRHLDIPTTDGKNLRATYFPASKPGPGMLLLHQCNMDRKSWDTLAESLATSGVHVLTFDYRGYGDSPESGGEGFLMEDIDAALATLVSQSGVDKKRLAAGGASCGVENAVQLALRNSQIKTLVLLSGPTSEEGIAWLKKNPATAIFGAASDEEDFAVDSLKAVVLTSTNSASTMRVLHDAGHGAPMFDADKTLLPALTAWIVKALK